MMAANTTDVLKFFMIMLIGVLCYKIVNGENIIVPTKHLMVLSDDYCKGLLYGKLKRSKLSLPHISTKHIFIVVIVPEWRY